MNVKSRTIVHRKGNSYWVGDVRDAEESSVVLIFEDGNAQVLPYEGPEG
jgi:hypothetical protein